MSKLCFEPFTQMAHQLNAPEYMGQAHMLDQKLGKREWGPSARQIMDKDLDRNADLIARHRARGEVAAPPTINTVTTSQKLQATIAATIIFCYHDRSN